jgi:hypothetical protein
MGTPQSDRNGGHDVWIPILCRDFYDIPRAFLVEHAGELLFFDCPFDDALDDYRNEFTVYCVDEQFRDHIDRVPWTDLASRSDRIGAVRTELVKFDATRRRAIHVEVFDLLEKNKESE